jgi:hypothetical protein
VNQEMDTKRYIPIKVMQNYYIGLKNYNINNNNNTQTNKKQSCFGLPSSSRTLFFSCPPKSVGVKPNDILSK